MSEKSQRKQQRKSPKAPAMPATSKRAASPDKTPKATSPKQGKRGPKTPPVVAVAPPPLPPPPPIVQQVQPPSPPPVRRVPKPPAYAPEPEPEFEMIEIPMKRSPKSAKKLHKLDRSPTMSKAATDAAARAAAEEAARALEKLNILKMPRTLDEAVAMSTKPRKSDKGAKGHKAGPPLERPSTSPKGKGQHKGTKGKKDLPFYPIFNMSAITMATQYMEPTEPCTGGVSAFDRADVLLPLNKVKNIMKTSPGIDQVGMDCVHAITKATELYVETLLHRAQDLSKDKRKISYQQLADAVQGHPSFDFLRDIIPQKMTYADALEQMAIRQAEDDEILFE